MLILYYMKKKLNSCNLISESGFGKVEHLVLIK